MIKVSVLYPNHVAGRFDMTYYLEKHMPMVRQKHRGRPEGLIG